MTKDKALKLALEALHYCEALNRPVHEQKIHAIAAIKESLAQPDAFEQGRQEGMKQERALWELSRLGQEIEAQPEQASTGCACRWDSEGDRVVTCARHEGWLEVIAEWADRAREAEKNFKALAQMKNETTSAYQRGLEALLERQTARIVDLQDEIRNLTGEE